MRNPEQSQDPQSRRNGNNPTILTSRLRVRNFRIDKYSGLTRSSARSIVSKNAIKYFLKGISNSGTFEITLADAKMKAARETIKNFASSLCVQNFYVALYCYRRDSALNFDRLPLLVSQLLTSILIFLSYLAPAIGILLLLNGDFIGGLTALALSPILLQEGKKQSLRQLYNYNLLDLYKRVCDFFDIKPSIWHTPHRVKKFFQEANFIEPFLRSLKLPENQVQQLCLELRSQFVLAFVLTDSFQNIED
ncbi:MAG: hypothetical protein NZO16_05025 [Deltaproteobacteria bacterium]|nr:hypothetical protein [Deltaproteobacteria bacterium]